MFRQVHDTISMIYLVINHLLNRSLLASESQERLVVEACSESKESISIGSATADFVMTSALALAEGALSVAHCRTQNCPTGCNFDEQPLPLVTNAAWPSSFSNATFQEEPEGVGALAVTMARRSAAVALRDVLPSCATATVFDGSGFVGVLLCTDATATLPADMPVL